MAESGKNGNFIATSYKNYEKTESERMRKILSICFARREAAKCLNQLKSKCIVLLRQAAVFTKAFQVGMVLCYRSFAQKLEDA